MKKKGTNPLDPEFIMDENQRVFNEFVFLFKNNYLFYLIATGQTHLIHRYWVLGFRSYNEYFAALNALNEKDAEFTTVGLGTTPISSTTKAEAPAVVHSPIAEVISSAWQGHEHYQQLWSNYNQALSEYTALVVKDYQQRSAVYQHLHQQYKPLMQSLAKAVYADAPPPPLPEKLTAMSLDELQEARLEDTFDSEDTYFFEDFDYLRAHHDAVERFYAEEAQKTFKNPDGTEDIESRQASLNQQVKYREGFRDRVVNFMENHKEAPAFKENEVELTRLYGEVKQAEVAADVELAEINATYEPLFKQAFDQLSESAQPLVQQTEAYIRTLTDRLQARKSTLTPEENAACEKCIEQLGEIYKKHLRRPNLFKLGDIQRACQDALGGLLTMQTESSQDYQEPGSKDKSEFQKLIDSVRNEYNFLSSQTQAASVAMPEPETIDPQPSAPPMPSTNMTFAANSTTLEEMHIEQTLGTDSSEAAVEYADLISNRTPVSENIAESGSGKVFYDPVSTEINPELSAPFLQKPAPANENISTQEEIKSDLHSWKNRSLETADFNENLANENVEQAVVKEPAVVDGDSKIHEVDGDFQDALRQLFKINNVVSAHCIPEEVKGCMARLVQHDFQKMSEKDAKILCDFIESLGEMDEASKFHNKLEKISVKLTEFLDALDQGPTMRPGH